MTRNGLKNESGGWKQKEAPTEQAPSQNSSKHSMEGSIVADCFVPARDRYINEREPLLVIQPDRVLANSEKQTQELRQSFCFSVPLVPHNLIKASGETLNQTLTQGNRRSQVPPPPGSPTGLATYSSIPMAGMPLRILAPDTHFAVRHRQQMKQSHQDPSPLSNGDKPLASLENIGAQSDERSGGAANSISQYCDTLEELLFAERRENLLLFERYSKYHYDKVSLICEEQQPSYASIEFEGIADAQPAVQVGDILLFRPWKVCGRKVPMPNNHFNPYHQHPYPPPPIQHGPTYAYGYVEVQAQVLSVTRASGRETNKKNVDRILVTWPEKAKMDQLAFEYDIPSSLRIPRAQIDHNIRIVPNPRPLVRCLTAVDWLRSMTIPQGGGTIATRRRRRPTRRTRRPSQQSENDKEPLGDSHTAPINVLQELLFPTKAPILPSIRDEDVLLPQSGDTNHLNPQQFSFVRLMLQRTLHPSTSHIRGPLILTGPAGTGKTRTMLYGIQRILALNDTAGAGGKRIRVLVCTPSHTAANVITRGLGEFLKPNQLFRLLDASRPSNTIPSDLSPFYRQDPVTGTFCLPSSHELLQFDVIVSTCLDAHLLYLAGCTNQQLRRHRMSVYQMAVHQLDASGISLSDSNAKRTIELFPHFSHLLLDEAAQATEAESLVPLSVVADPSVGVQKVEVVLVGDPRQLSPQVFCEKAVDAGFRCSWMERMLRRPAECTGGGHETLLGEDQSQIESLLKYSLQSQTLLSVFLTMNYRGHPSFLTLPSALFYSDLLQSAPLRPEGKSKTQRRITNQSTILSPLDWLDKLRMLECLAQPVLAQDDDGGDNVVLEELLVPRKQFGFPIHFRGVVGRDVDATIHHGFTSNSWKNREEADAVVEIIKCLTSMGENNGKVAVDPRSIGVCSPFRGQVDLIRKLLRQNSLGNVDVGTIEDYQAVEWDVIILSLTRSTQSLVSNDIARRMGVFGQPKRSNVALTRAENLFIVVGNPNTCMADYYVWRQFLLFCHRNGLWYGDNVESVPRPSESVLSTNLEQLIDKQTEEESDALTEPSNEQPTPPSHTTHNGVIISSLERLLRSSNIV